MSKNTTQAAGLTAQELQEAALYGKKAGLGRLLSYFKPYAPQLAFSIAMALIINAAVIIRPYLLRNVIDNYLVPGVNDQKAITGIALLYFGLIIAGAVVGYVQNYLLTWVGQDIMKKMRNDLFQKVQHMSMSFFDRFSSGRLLTRVTNDVEALNDLFSGVIVNLFRDTVMIAGIIWVMFSLNATMAVISIICVPLIWLTVLLYRKAARKNFIRMKALIGRLNGFLAENITGMKIVQIFHREKQKYDEYMAIEKEYFKSSLREIILNSLCRPVVDVINNLTISILIWLCAGRIMNGFLEIGVLYAFITYIRQFFEPINEISDKFTTLQSAFVSAQRIFEIMDIPDQTEELDTGIPCPELKGEIEFRNVWFAYEGENWVLKNVSFHVRPGETIAFVGATGSGKSTIISLIARFYTIRKGEILLDGVNIEKYRLSELRRRIAVVMQDVFLFSGDIASNLRLNDQELSDEALKEAARTVSADTFIESLPGAYHAVVQERGCTFSAGQRQLLSFARAVVHKPNILILDEATANIDTETEKLVQKSLEQLTRNRTAIIIAHRLSTIRKADRIFLLHKGNIIETGSHDELMEKNGVYRQMIETQLGKVV